MFKESIPSVENKDKELFDFEKWLSNELPKQYTEKARILNELGLLEILPEAKDIGIVAIDGKEYPLPEQEDIERIFKENKEVFEKKMKQGFTEMEIVPFGLPLERFIKTAEKAILKHHKEGKLYANRKDPEDEAEKLIPLELDESQPLYHWDGYDNADINGKMVYFPEKFDKDPQKHKGKTKEQIIQETKQGFQIILREKNLNIPRAGKRETIGGRKQPEANQTPNEYLNNFKNNPTYEHEEGQTPEDWLTVFLTHLEKNNQAIDDCQGNGSIAYNLGTWFPADSFVSDASWNRGDRRVSLFRSVPRFRDGVFGARGRVRVL